MTARLFGLIVTTSLLTLNVLETRAANAADEVQTVSVATIGRPVVARLDAQGTIHLLCDSEEGPKYAKSTDGGATFSKSIAVVNPTGSVSGLEYNAWDMAIGRSGRVHVAMGTNAWKLKLPKEEWGYFHVYLDPEASAFSPVRNINKTPSEGFSIAADARGNVTACWLSDKLYANISHDDGKTFEASTELNPAYNPCNCCTTSSAYGLDGKLAILYREETNNERDMYTILWDQAKGETTRQRVGRTSWKIDACPMTYFTIVPDRDGFLATWPTSGSIYFAKLDGRAGSSGPPEIATPGRSGMRTGMTALAGPDGRTLIAWKVNHSLGWQGYDAAGRPQGPRGSASSPGTGVAGVFHGGRFVLFR